MPKSGEHDEKTAPSDAAASMVITASGRLGSHAATRSPGRTPSSSSAAARAPTSRTSSLPLHSSRWPVSSWLMIAGSSPAHSARRFSATFRWASGKNRVAGMSWSGTTASTPRRPTTPH